LGTIEVLNLFTVSLFFFFFIPVVIGRFTLSLSVVIHFFYLFLSHWPCVIGSWSSYLVGEAFCRLDVLLCISSVMSPLIYLYTVVVGCQLCVLFLSWFVVIFTVYRVEILLLCVLFYRRSVFRILFGRCVHCHCWLVTACIRIQAKLLDAHSFAVMGAE
jgi:hypothetical protein